MREPTQYEAEVCAAVQRIQWGKTRTYTEIAEAIGGSAQSVGGAQNRVKEHCPELAAMIPWHRLTLMTDGPKGQGLYPASENATQKQVRRLMLEGHTFELRGGHTYDLVD